jgi:hypothetical protein
VTLAVGASRQRRPDHLNRVRPPEQARHRQQHMRHPTSGAPSPPRPQHHQPTSLPDRPGPGMTPPGQPAPTPRTRHRAFTQPPLDVTSINPYRDQRCLHAPRTAPPTPPSVYPGGPSLVPGRRHADGADQEDQPRPAIPTRRHPQRRSSATSSASSAGPNTKGQREVPGASHALSVSRPDAVTASILQAADAVAA